MLAVAQILLPGFVTESVSEVAVDLSFGASELATLLLPKQLFREPKWFAMKAVRFLALSFLLLLCHSALLRVMSFLRRMLRSSDRGPLSSSLASLNRLLLQLLPELVDLVCPVVHGIGEIHCSLLLQTKSLSCSADDDGGHCLEVSIIITLGCSFQDGIGVFAKLEPLLLLDSLGPFDPTMF